MRFRTMWEWERPHEDRPLRGGDGQAGSILVSLHALPDVDVDTVMAELEKLLRGVLDDWFAASGHKLVEAVPDVA